MQEKLDEVLSDIATSNINTLGQVRETNTFVDGHDVRNSVTRVQDDTIEETFQKQKDRKCGLEVRFRVKAWGKGGRKSKNEGK